MKIIAVDFDGCLCENRYPEIGKAYQGVINKLVELRRDGAKLILWTCRCGEWLDDAVRWCAEHGLEFDAVNDNLPENTEYFGNNSRKVYATEYWDDRNVIVTNGVYCRAVWADAD